MVLKNSLRFAALYCDLVKAVCGGRKLIDTAAKAFTYQNEGAMCLPGCHRATKTVRIGARGEFIVELAKAIQKGWESQNDPPEG